MARLFTIAQAVASLTGAWLYDTVGRFSDSSVESKGGLRMKISSAIVLCAVLGVLVVPACEIRIQQGEPSGQTPPDNTTGAGAGTGGATSTLTPEELAAIDALQKADPIEIARITDTAAFAAVTTSNLVGAQIVDPSTLDAATASQLIDSVAPDAINAALAWAQSADPSIFSARLVCLWVHEGC